MSRYLQKKSAPLFFFTKKKLERKLYEHKFSFILFQQTVLIYETGADTEATAPSTTAGPGFDGVPVPLVLAAAEFLCA